MYLVEVVRRSWVAFLRSSLAGLDRAKLAHRLDCPDE